MEKKAASAIMLTLLLIGIVQVQAAWWNTDWEYKKPITITEQSGSTLTNYQVKLVVLYDADMQSDFDDLRFTYWDGATETPISYWVEKYYAGENATVWVKVPSIPASGTTALYMYYGNPVASSESSFDNTFTKDYGESGQAGLWHMDEGSGTTTADASGNGNTGTLMNGPVWQSSDGGQWDGRSEVKFSTGSDLYFDGSDDYVRVLHSSSLNIAGNLTIELWINPQMASLTLTGADPGLGLVSKRTANVPSPYVLRIFSGGGIDFHAWYTNVGDWRSVNTWPSTPIVLNQWQHIAVTRTLAGSAVTISIYYNAALQVSATNNWGAATTNNHDLWLVRDPYFAAYTNEGTFKGLVDEVRIYNRPLSTGEIRSHYERRKYAALEPTYSFGSEEVHTGISGKVTQTDGVTPVVGALVEALQQGDLVAASTNTDLAGTYALALSPAAYKVRVKADNYITAIKPVVNVASETTTTVNFNLSIRRMLVFDDFIGTSLNASKWNTHLTGIGSVGIYNATGVPTEFSCVGISSGYGGAGSAAITSKLTATLDSTIIFEGRVSAYWEAHWYPGVYGDKQPRGLRVGTDSNNAIEFISYARDTVEARTVASGVATVTQYLLPSGKMVGDWNLTYRIEATSALVKFYVNDVLIASHTTNIPTGPLNIYVGTNYPGYGNVPVSADYLYMAVLPWGDWKHYHNYNEIVNTLLYLNVTYPSIVDVFSIGKSWQNKDIYAIRLTNESNTHPKPKVFFAGYHHARELISAELPLYFAVEAATNFGTNETITHMLNYSEIYIVPALNVDAFDAVKQNEWQRKNVHPYDEDEDTLLDEDPPDDEDGDGYIEDLFFWNGTYYEFIRWEGIDNDSDTLLNEDWIGGVDLNRNYGYQWDATCDSGSPYPWAEDYRGPAPFSEPEAQAIRDLALSHNFKYAISFHSGTEVIGYPWGYTTDPTVDDAIFREIAANLSQLVGAPYGQNSGLYTMSGSWDDWMYGNRSTFALTCEIYTNQSAWQYEFGPEPDTYWEKGVFQFFNPYPSQIETVIQRWLPVFTYITNRAITEAYDVTTTNVTPLKTVIGQGYFMNINVTLANQGEFTETFNVTVYANTTSIASQTITLTSGNSTTITFTWNTSGFAKGNYTISAQATQIPGETDTKDNTLTDGWIAVTVPGDIDGDFRVSYKDLFALAAAYGSKPGDLNWDPACDVDGDNKVGYKDLFILAANYGKKYP